MTSGLPDLDDLLLLVRVARTDSIGVVGQTNVHPTVTMIMGQPVKAWVHRLSRYRRSTDGNPGLTAAVRCP
jgi:hypothetical protein